MDICVQNPPNSPIASTLHMTNGWETENQRIEQPPPMLRQWAQACPLRTVMKKSIATQCRRLKPSGTHHNHLRSDSHAYLIVLSRR